MFDILQGSHVAGPIYPYLIPVWGIKYIYRSRSRGCGNVENANFTGSSKKASLVIAESVPHKGHMWGVFCDKVIHVLNGEKSGWPPELSPIPRMVIGHLGAYFYPPPYVGVG